MMALPASRASAHSPWASSLMNATAPCRRRRVKDVRLAPMREFEVAPNPDDPRLTRRLSGRDQEGRTVEAAVVEERPLTLFLNGREIVMLMTIGDFPDCLAVGYLLNQGMLQADDA